MINITYLNIISILLLLLPRLIFVKSIEKAEEHGGGKLTMEDPKFYICLGVSLFLCLFAGICSGLTVGYLSIDKLSLELKIRTGSDEDKNAAIAILPIIENRHVLMSTLLIANAICLETLPIFLEAIMSGIFAVAISTVCVVVFSEILPQALCTGPSQLIIAKKMAPLIRILNFTFGIISYPLGRMLDHLLGKHDDDIKFHRRDLKALISLHQKGPENEGILLKEEAQLIESTIDLRLKPVSQIKIPIEKVFTIHENEIINQELINRLLIKNYSRIPVFDKTNNSVIGIVKAKSLIDIFVTKKGKRIRGNVDMHEPLIVASDTTLFEMLRIFQEQKASLALISGDQKRLHDSEDNFISRNDLIIKDTSQESSIIGLVALNDIFEELMMKEFNDSDVHQSLNQFYHLKKGNKVKRKKTGGGKEIELETNFNEPEEANEHIP